MKKMLVILLIIVMVVVMSFTIAIGWFVFGWPVGTSVEVEKIVIDKMPREYVIDSIKTVQRMSDFEGEQTNRKWLVVTLKNKTVTDEKEVYKIAEPICMGLLVNDTDYEGVDIYPHKDIDGRVNCSTWGP